MSSSMAWTFGVQRHTFNAMHLLTVDERTLALDIAALVYANPFLEERITHEKRILGDGYVESGPYWSLMPDAKRDATIDAIAARCGTLVETLRSRLNDARPSREDLQLYDDVVIYFLYERYREAILGLIERGEVATRVDFYPRFRADVSTYLGGRADSAHLFACFYQVRRAFHHVFRNIVGRTRPVARLRATVWQSIFTHDVRRYRRSLWPRMGDVPSLITGPTGTGKELVARAIAFSRYIPFDERHERFTGPPQPAFVAVNLSALSPALIESELFGHRKGAFTGASADRVGFLESCGTLGSVFLDEIGEVEPSIQVKLLRVLQSRTLQRLGETTTRPFEGKLIAATNRDLAGEIRKGRFREDFYYRLCADTVTTPALQAQLAGSPDELRHLIRFICTRVAGEEESETLAAEVVRSIEVSPGLGYHWPGNFRELEQCVRSVMLRGTYEPRAAVHTDARQRIAHNIVAGHFSADDLLRHYCTLLYATSRNYSTVAEKLQIDRRTVRAKVDQELLREL
jgi:transcriptional regulator with AAA-type ATPase domain